MAQFNSPLGKQNIRPQQAFRTISVPDGSDEDVLQEVDFDALQRFAENVPETDEETVRVSQEMRRSKKTIDRLGEGAKKRIEMLLGMTRTTKEIEVGGNVYVLQTLKSKEARECIMEASKFDGTVQTPFEIRKQFLSRSLKVVAGIEIEQFVGSNELSAKLAFLDELDEHLIGRLYEEYVKLTEEAKGKFAANSEEKISEVLEDLKK